MSDFLRLPKKTLYALEAVVDVAYNARPDPVQSKDITKRQGIPPRYLEQAMQQLVHAGILKGVRGPRGGYTLARERRRITVAQIIQVIAADEGDEDSRGSDIGERVVQPFWGEVQEELLGKLGAVTLDDLCNRARAIGIGRAGDTASNFTI